jgi:hypothetical protein
MCRNDGKGHACLIPLGSDIINFSTIDPNSNSQVVVETIYKNYEEGIKTLLFC